MPPPEILLLVVGVAILAVITRLVAGSMDDDRVGDYIRRQGGELLESHWSPFGRGWFGERNDRIYEIRYRDRAGNIHEASVKTSLFSGVYLTDDRIVASAPRPHEADAQREDDDLNSENARLRQRIAELEREKEA